MQDFAQDAKGWLHKRMYRTRDKLDAGQAAARAATKDAEATDDAGCLRIRAGH